MNKSPISACAALLLALAACNPVDPADPTTVPLFKERPEVGIKSISDDDRTVRIEFSVKPLYRMKGEVSLRVSSTFVGDSAIVLTPVLDTLSTDVFQVGGVDQVDLLRIPVNFMKDDPLKLTYEIRMLPVNPPQLGFKFDFTAVADSVYLESHGGFVGVRSEHARELLPDSTYTLVPLTANFALWSRRE